MDDGGHPVVDHAVDAKSFWTGTHRVCSPKSTTERLTHLLPIMGITRVADVTGLDDIGIPVVMVTRPNSRGLSVAQGKGFDLDTATASGIMESIEGFHAERVTEPLRLASAREMSPAASIIDPQAGPWALANEGMRDEAVLWICGQDLVAGTERWVPYDLVHLDYTGSSTLGSNRIPTSSNGLASGNTYFEAVSHALCELIERDAHLLWRLRPNSEQTDRLDLATIDDPHCLELIKRFHDANVLLAAWDITTDIGVPTFIAHIVDAAGGSPIPRPPASGAGCHPSAHVALSRALTEAAQSRLSYIAGSRDDLDRSKYLQLLDPQVVNEFRDLISQQEHCVKPFRPGLGCSHSTVGEDVNWLLEQLTKRGVSQVVIVDISRPLFGIAVVRAIAPQLEHQSERNARYVPGERAAQWL